MMFLARIMRVFVVLLLAAAGTALVGLKTNGAGLAEGIAAAHGQNAAAPDVVDSTSDIAHDILIQAASIRTRPENDQIAVDGPGTLSLWVDRRFLNTQIDDPAKNPRAETMLLRITWTRGMQLVGRTNDAEDRATAQAEFRGNVVAQLDDGSIRCEERMTIRMTKPVSLERIQIVLKGRASDTLLRRPQTTIAKVEAYRNVVVQGNMIDPEKQVFVHKQRIRCDAGMIYDSRTGEFQVSGKGELLLEDVSPPPERPAIKGATHPGPRIISFGGGMIVRTGSQKAADRAARDVQLFGGVTVDWPNMEGGNIQAKADRSTVKAQNLRLVVGQITGQSDRLFWIRADGGVETHNGDPGVHP